MILLKDVNNLINIDKSGKFKYYYISCLEQRGIIDFIYKLDVDSFYIVIPMLSIFARDNDAHIILSK
jgi:hypothetical protein